MDRLQRFTAKRRPPKKRMLVTGAKGLLGREIFHSFCREYEVSAAGVRECDVTSPMECRRAILGFRPDVVVHCAAYTAVDKAESEEETAFSVNAFGTRNVARLCRETGCLMVTYGSDYVFDGKSTRPYEEEDEAHPLSVYARSKWGAEQALREEDPEFLLIRSQWIYGPHGRNFVFAILDRARRGEPLRVVSDQTGCPTYARDLAEATKRLIDVRARGTFHFSNEGETTWFEFARFILDHACPGPVSLSSARTDELPYPAPRPAYSVLSKEKYRKATGVAPRSWEEALLEFLKRTYEGGVAW
ncbi:MAG: dTDP-4-dehydrorhamnose reductase [Deltaproteobacteria bacterium]|nr:dTDP-4-dehydrorhamnose reductase [Deltaproteobacteria bacterium]